VLGLACSVLLLASNPALDSARERVRELKYNAAGPLLAKAREVSGNDHAQVLEILWLQGLVAATLNRKDDARTVFRQLLLLEPDFKVQGDLPPKVMTPFYEAKNWAATNGPLMLVLEGGTGQVAARVEHDALSLARGVRFWVRSAKGAWVEHRTGVAQATVTLPPPGPHEVWAELLGERDAVIALSGSAEKPLQVGLPPAAPVVRAEPEAPVATAPPPPPPPPPVVEASSPTGESHTARWVGLGAGAAALVSFGVGALFGSFSRQAAAQLTGLQMMHMGTPVTELSQADAFALNDRLKTDAVVANVLFGLGAALAITALLLILLGRS
jgi:hypothetical protein